MLLTMASAGRGSRLGNMACRRPKTLIEVKGKPILAHIIDRVREQFPLKGVITTSRLGTNGAWQFAEFMEKHYAGSGISFANVAGEPRGVGYAFFLAMGLVGRTPPQDIILSVSDVLARDYSVLGRSKFDVLIGAIPFRESRKKQRMMIGRSPDGNVLFDASSVVLRRCYANVGIYCVKRSAFSAFHTTFSDRMLNHSSDLFLKDAKGEYRMTWIWQELQRQGIKIGIADVKAIAELNHPEDLPDFERI
ncbi:MAG: hypothetical protein U9R38_08345 [Candidatus Margulisiibacteriota bacterium]|nr:hypothetical protein [Candidatus Margulisiibacteriota bacterium]